MNWRSPALRITLVLLVAGAIGVSIISFREYKRGERIQGEIDMLKGEADKIKIGNEDLGQKIMYFNSPDFQEREAKDKLGFKRLEEKVVLLPGTPHLAPSPSLSDGGSLSSDTQENLPNYRKWWNLFSY